MKNSLKKIFLKNPSNPAFWILIALLVKGVLPFLQLFAHRPHSHLLGFGFIGDSPSYTDPVENFIKTGHYSPDLRMPGYGIIYYLLRLIFSYTGAYNTIVIVQLVVSSVSVYCIALTSRLVTKAETVFYLVFYLFLISIYSNYYDICLMTEALCSAFLIFGTWHLASYFENNKNIHLFFSGFFITWSLFLRPIFGGVFVLYGFIILIHLIKKKKKILLPVLVYGLTFIVFDGAWIIRNYNVHRKIVPLTNGIRFPYNEYSYITHELNFVQSWGGAVDIPDPHSAISWFGGMPYPNEPVIKEYDSIPGYIYTSKFNKDSLYLLRDKVKKFMALQKPAIDSFYLSKDSDWMKVFSFLYSPLKPVSFQAYALQNNISNTFDRYTASIRTEKPFLYYVKARAILLWKFFFKNNESYFIRGQIPGLRGISIFFNRYYYEFLLVLGIAGIIFMTGTGIRKNYLLLLLCTIPAYTIIIHPIILRAADNRYLFPAWPFIIACAAYFITILLRLFKKANHPKTGA